MANMASRMFNCSLNYKAKPHLTFKVSKISVSVRDMDLKWKLQCCWYFISWCYPNGHM